MIAALRALRYLLVMLWLVLRFLLAVVTAKDAVFTDPNEDIRQAWQLLNDDTQPIPIIR